MAIQYDTLVTQSLAKQIADNIHEAIVAGHFRAEDRLPTEEQLAQRFNVSRPTVREALKRLAAQNLIRSQRGPKGGTFVKRPSAEDARSALTTATTMLVSLGEFDLTEIAEARHELERICCRLAVERRTEQDLDRLEAEIEVQQQAISDEEFCASDVRFHRALVDACGNPLLQFNLCTVIEALQPVSNMLIFRHRKRDQIMAQHQRLFEAIRDQNEAEALAALDQQMAYLREQFAIAQAERSTEHEKDIRR